MRIGKMARVKVTVDDHVHEVIIEKEKLVNIALEVIGTKCADYAAMNLERNPRRVDTGRLKNSITHEVVPEESMVEVGTNVEYAVYVEYGTGKFADGGGRSTPWLVKVPNNAGGKWAGKTFITRGMKPNHFLRDAVQNHKKEYLKIAKDILDGDL